ncbi:MAG: FAD-dependent oxidoreductase, partial [Desulfobulbaceae bacterium]|nr:FAD-dependent oxidoreductase [Desulfobulbaceae bacterium]
MTLAVIRRVWLVLVCLGAGLVACGERQSGAGKDSDVIVVGAGLSGLSAAVEMGRSGLNVLVIDMNSVAGGHTMLAGGVAMAATPLQERLGIEDSAELAYDDWMGWSKDGDAEWTRYYAANSRKMIYDWVTEMGVEFVRVVPSHGNSVPRFHFTQGRAAHLVLPIYRTALGMPNISFLWNARAQELLVEGERVTGVAVKDLRGGGVRRLTADNVVLATGGFQSDVERVLANWIPGLPRPDRLLIGSAISATGSGHDMAADAGAALAKIDRHFIYVNGVLDPRDQQRSH